MGDINMDYLEIYSMLDEKNDQEIQSIGINFAMEMKDVDKFILPMHPHYNKNIWENCAKILEKKSDQELKPYLLEILEWLQDLNWPGVFTIIERLKKFDGALLLEPYKQTLFFVFDKDEENQEWCDYLSVLIENQELVDNLPQELYVKMKAIYDDYWGKN